MGMLYRTAYLDKSSFTEICSFSKTCNFFFGTIFLVGCDSDFSVSDNEENITFGSLLNFISIIIIYTVLPYKVYDVQVILKLTCLIMHWPSSNDSSSRQSAIFLSLSSDILFKSLTARSVSNLSWSFDRPADWTTVWKMVRSMAQSVTGVLVVIVAVRRQLYRMANSPNNEP